MKMLTLGCKARRYRVGCDPMRYAKKNMRIRISKTSIALFDESDRLLEECQNNISCSRILVQNIESAEAFFKELIKKHCRSILRPKITVEVDGNIF